MSRKHLDFAAHLPESHDESLAENSCELLSPLEGRMGLLTQCWVPLNIESDDNEDDDEGLMKMFQNGLI